jgi:hypothetical protein
MRRLIVFALGLFAAAATAHAVVPTLALSVQDRHVTATFSAPAADGATIYFASKPDRATDGSFFTENVEHLDTLTDDEIASGRWVDESAIEPGLYYVMLRAYPDFDRCYLYGSDSQYDQACAQGYSSVTALNVTPPASRYRVATQLLQYSGTLQTTIWATPLGVKRPYRVCYRSKAGAQRCTAGRIDGYDWNSAGSDTLSLATRFMPNRVSLTWWVGASRVASKTVRVR